MGQGVKPATLYVIAFRLGFSRDHAEFFAQLRQLRAHQAFEKVWVLHADRYPESSAEQIRNELGQFLDERVDSLLVIGVESPVNLAAFGDKRWHREVFNLPGL